MAKGGKTIQILKVALPKVLRNSNRVFRGLRKDKEGNILYDEVGVALVNKWGKEKMGDEGTMTREDFEAKNYAPYGLKEYFDTKGKIQQIDAVITENSKLQEVVIGKDQRIAELEKKLAELAESITDPTIEPANEYVGKSKSELVEIATEKGIDVTGLKVKEIIEKLLA